VPGRAELGEDVLNDVECEIDALRPPTVAVLSFEALDGGGFKGEFTVVVNN
jgi:hypothetical protein